jgi:hypothetical protein
LTAWDCSIVDIRQQPKTANGVIFANLEHETGSVKVIVWRYSRVEGCRPGRRQR